MQPSAAPGRLSCDTCGTSYRDECDLTRHRRTKAHLARCAGRSPPARSRCGEAKRDRPQPLQPGDDDGPTLPIGFMVRSVRMVTNTEEAPNTVVTLQEHVDEIRPHPPARGVGDIRVDGPVTSEWRSTEIGARSGDDAVLVGILSGWFESVAGAAEHFANSLASCSGSGWSQELALRLRQQAERSRRDAAWLTAEHAGGPSGRGEYVAATSTEVSRQHRRTSDPFVSSAVAISDEEWDPSAVVDISPAVDSLRCESLDPESMSDVRASPGHGMNWIGFSPLRPTAADTD
jgi:hypothetical protein